MQFVQVAMRSFVLLLLAIFLAACDGSREKSADKSADKSSAVVTTRLLQLPGHAEVVETTADALPLWRRLQRERPTLLLLSNKALTPPLPQSHQELTQALVEASDAELVRRSGRPAADPLLRPEMAVAAMMQREAFSRVVWVVPIAAGNTLTLDGLVQQLRKAAPGWNDEIATFRVQDGKIIGTLAKTPVEVVTIDQLSGIAAPLLVHIDTGYFQPLYRGEIKTPLYGLIRQQLTLLSKPGYRPLAITVSRDTLFDGLPLETRFVAPAIAEFIARPELLQQPSPLEVRRSETLYVENFFSNDQVLAASEKLVTAAPGDPAANFAMYSALRRVGRFAEALAALQKAVTLDPYYALEYAALIDQSLTGEDPGQGLSATASRKAVEFYGKAIAALPGDPFLRLRNAELSLMLGQGETALSALQQLQQLPWSQIYYPGIPAQISALQKKIADGTSPRTN